MSDRNIVKKGQVRRLVRKQTARAAKGDENQTRAAPPPSCSWACARVAAPREQGRAADNAELDHPVLRADKVRAVVPRSPRKGGLLGGVVSLAVLAGGFLALLISSLRNGSVWKGLLVAVAALVGGMFLEYTTGPAAPILAYLGKLGQDIRGWLNPATQTALAAGSILVGVGFWLVIQILRTAPADSQAAARRAYIPREMYERHA